MDKSNESSIMAYLQVLAEARSIALSTAASTGQYASQDTLTRLSTLLIQLKSLNRNMHLSNQKINSTAIEKRAAVDRLLLQLQNLYYEKTHLLGEIEQCDNYLTTYNDLEMDTEEQFRERHKDLKEDDDEHGILVLRLEDELSQRKQANDYRKELVQRKEELVVLNERKQSRLARLDEKLASFIEV